jgi:hypothetical protein
MYTGREGETIGPRPTSALSPASGEIFVNLAGGFVQGICNHESTRGSSNTLMVSFDQYERSDLLGDKRETFNIDFHRNQSRGERQQIVWGVAYRRTAERSEGSVNLSLNPPNQTASVFSGFFQDEIAIFRDGRTLEAMSYPFTEPDGTPVLISVFGNPRIKDERLTAYEAGYRTAIGRHLSVDLAAYYNDYDNQITTEPATAFFESTPLPAHLFLPSMLANLSDGETNGPEVAAKWSVTTKWTLTPSYDFERIHMHRRAPSQDTESGPDTEGSDPRQHTLAIPSGTSTGRFLGHQCVFHGPAAGAGSSILHKAGHRTDVALEGESIAQRLRAEPAQGAASGIRR